MSCYDTGSSNKYLFTEMKNDVSTGDGRYKLVYAINGEIPGPNIVVFEDQVVSTLSNDLTDMMFFAFCIHKNCSKTSGHTLLRGFYVI